MDYQGTQYWSDEITVIPNQENLIELNLEQLALDLTNDPLAVRFDGVAPVYMSGPIRVATLGSLTGLLAQGVIAQTPEEKVYYYITDHLGTPQKAVDSAGVVVWSGYYRPFGEVTSGVSTVQNNFRFPGQYYDPETGFHYNYHRYYDPRTGRYLRPDPIGLAGGINLYLYVENNTIKSIDPSGEFGVIGIVAIGAAVLTTGDFIITTYYDYQIVRLLDRQERFYRALMARTPLCSEHYEVLRKAHAKVVLEKGALTSKMGMNLLLEVSNNIKPAPNPQPKSFQFQSISRKRKMVHTDNMERRNHY